METTAVKRRLKHGLCEECGEGCRSEWVETPDGVELVNPRCRRHKPGARERSIAHVKKYEVANGVNEKVYFFVDRNGKEVRCKKAYYFRAKKLGKIASEPQPA